MFSIKKRISSDILGGAIGSAFGCYDCKVQATGRFLVRSQAEELLLLLFPSTRHPCCSFATGEAILWSSFQFAVFWVHTKFACGVTGDLDQAEVVWDFATSTSISMTARSAIV
jgi:hypothetical protein